ncbi:MAG: hypothetical protein EOO90_07630 [Pedobacter sp.]|nr:MAG: hypothetical protein EOO90_07630 [Pedobacter sp.]
MSVLSFKKKKPVVNSYHIQSSKIFITGGSKANDWTLNIDTFACEGYFKANIDELEEIKGLHFRMPVSELRSSNVEAEKTIKSLLKNKNCEEISFTQKRRMILPIMKMVHVIGDFKMGNGIHSAPMQIQYTIDSEKSMTLVAKQFIKLSEFGIMLPNTKPGDDEEEITINISLKLVKTISKSNHLSSRSPE